MDMRPGAVLLGLALTGGSAAWAETMAAVTDDATPVAAPSPEDAVDNLALDPADFLPEINWQLWAAASASAQLIVEAPVRRIGLLPDPLPESSGDDPVLPGLLPAQAAWQVRGEPYRITSLTLGRRQTGLASWYGPGFSGRRTASGEIFNMHQLTAAHRTLPLPSYVRVTHESSGKSVIVKVNDRGPYHAGRMIDLSYAAARKLGMTSTARVSLEPVEGEQKVGSLRPGLPLPAGETVHSVMLGNFRERVQAENLEGRLMAQLPPGVPVRVLQAAGPIRAWRVEVGPLVSNTEVHLLIRGIRAARLGLMLDIPLRRPGKR